MILAVETIALFSSVTTPRKTLVADCVKTDSGIEKIAKKANKTVPGSAGKSLKIFIKKLLLQIFRSPPAK